MAFPSSLFAKLKNLRSWPLVWRCFFIVLPVILCGWLVKENVTDTRFNDDWMLGETLLKYREGTLTWHDIVAVQMEHRLAVPRLLVLFVHQFTKDMRVENIITFVLLCGMLWNLLWLLRRVSFKDGGLRQWWLPGALIALTLFSPVQYQTLLWACTFTSVLPGFFLSLALVAWWSKLNRWLAIVLAALCAMGGMMSFASGLNIWPLMLVVVLLGRADIPWLQRRQYALAWLGIMAVALLCYFHNFSNAVKPEFAYNQGSEVTMQRSIMVFFTNSGRAIEFLLAILGCHLGRGWHQDNVRVSQFFGALTLLLFGLALWLLLRRRTDLPQRLERALPWVILVMQSLQTGLMIGMGRLWVGQTVAQAVTARYCAYEVYSTVGLIGLAALAVHGLLANKESLPPWLQNWSGRVLLAPVTAMFLISIQVVEWSYGSQMMRAWHYTRLEGVALLKFLYVLPNHSYLSIIEGGNGDDVARLATALDKQKLLYPKPLQDLRLENFKLFKRPLKTSLARFDSLILDPAKGLIAEGYAALPRDHRAADAVLLASRKKSHDSWQIFGVVTVNATPGYLHQATQRDLEFISSEHWLPETSARWSTQVYAAGKAPDPEEEISAWALDIERNAVLRIPDGRSVSPGGLASGTVVYRRKK